ncbi:hypothetical protein Tco_1491503 [Tanacetum coccineum]
MRYDSRRKSTAHTFQIALSNRVDLYSDLKVVGLIAAVSIIAGRECFMIPYKEGVTKDEGNDGVEIIMVNIIPPDHVDDVLVVESNQHDDVPVIPEPVLVDPLNPPPPASDSEPEDVIKFEDTGESEDEIVPASVHEVGESSTAPFLREDIDSLLPGLMRRDINSIFGQMVSLSRRLCGRETTHALVEKKGKAKDGYYGKLVLDLGNEVRSSVEQRTDAMENLVKKLGNTKEKANCEKLKKELEEARRFVFEERPNEAIDVLIVFEERPRTDSIESASDYVGKKSPSSEPRESPHDA